jgi:hypothetical protein
MKTQLCVAAIAASLLSTAAFGAKGDYAEALYRDYGSLSQGAVSFELEVLEQGPLEKLSGQPLVNFTGLPEYTIVVDADSDIRRPQAAFARADLTEIYLQDLEFSVEGFAEVGFPLELGDYRLLAVNTGIGKQRQSHIALEFCWAAQGHCVVFDPNIDFIDSEVNSWRSAVASGWGLQIHEESAAIDTGKGISVQAACGLASNPSVTSRSYSRGSRTVTYKNLYGITMVQKSIGAVQAGLRCSTSCSPSPFGYANASSAWANIPFSVACGNKVASGTSGGRGKFVAKSGCSHRTVLGASFSATAKGVGLSVDVQIDATGSVDLNGTEYIDTCGYY